MTKHSTNVKRCARRSVWHGLSRLAVAVCLAWAVGGGWATAQAADDGPAYDVNQMYLDFAEDLPVHPPTKLMMRMDIKLGVTDSGYVAPRDGIKNVELRLEEIPTLSKKKMHLSAINAICHALVEHFEQWGYQGITVAPHPEDITAEGKDIRLQGQTALRLVASSMTGRGRPRRVGPIWEGPDARDGKAYNVNQLIITAAPGIDGAPKRKLLNTPVALGETEEGYIAPRQGVKTVQVRLVDIPKLPMAVFYESALRQISEAMTKTLHQNGVKGVYAWPHPEDIDEQGNDVRFKNQTALRYQVTKGELPEKPQFIPPPRIAKATDDQATPVFDDSDLPDAAESDGPAYPISQVILDYAKDHPGLPPLKEVMDVKLTLTPKKGGYAAPRTGDQTITTSMVELSDLPMQKLYASAVRHINQRLVQQFNQMGYIGIYIAPNSDDIAPDGEDVRPEGQTALRLDVQTGVVSELRTLASGDRIPDEERSDNPMHQRILAQSPIQPAAEGEEDPQDLLRKDLLDDYIYRLNRHPGRRVDVAVHSGLEPGTIGLDYLITESKPWMVYAQISNTGTEQTDEWRERFGFIHNQLTNNDDILTIDYITANFDSVHAVMGSYEAPLGDSERWRWKVQGSYSEFTASDVGFATQDFTGEEWMVGADLIANIWWEKEQFLDLVFGLKYKRITVNDPILMLEGESDFFLPHVGLEYERYTDTASTFASVNLEMNVPSVATAEQSELERLGRLFPDEDFMRAQFSLTHSFYLEPWLWRQAWEDTNTPESSTLAHELAFSLKGQYAFGTRLIPQAEMTAGGLYTVRGYDESQVAGDTVLIGTAEYRFHLPRMFSPREPGSAPLFGRPFRWAPQQVYGRPDWDLVFRGFFDYAKTFHSDKIDAFESDETLMSAGAGVELMLKRNFSIRMDWGYVLNDVQGGGGKEEGDTRFHIVGTLLY